MQLVLDRCRAKEGAYLTLRMPQLMLREWAIECPVFHKGCALVESSGMVRVAQVETEAWCQ